MSLFAELKRRNVFRVGIAYLIGSWLLAQIAELILDTFDAPDWTMKFIMVVLLIGFPIAVFMAWAFELTPDGVKRESEVDRSQSIRQQTANRMDRGIIVILVIALAYFVWESRFAAKTEPGSDPFSQQTAEKSTELSGKRALTPDEANPAAIEVAITEPTSQSVAVLPFINMSSDPEQEYFSDGITEEIINALVKIPGLSVPARTSVFGFKGQQGDVRKIGEQLGVTHVLEGSIRSQGNQVRITAQLIKVDDGFHLWSETFDRQLDNIFVVQEEIATAIATVLTGELGLKVATVPNQTRNMKAYDLYLQGRALLRKRDDQAIEVLLKAARSDPGFAPAWAALAIAYQVSDSHPVEAMETAQKALQLDPNNVDALNAMASTLRAKMRWSEAEEYYQRALAIDPQSSELLEDYAEFLAYVGRTEEALEVTTRGFAIDQNLLPLTLAHAEALLSNGKLDEALILVDEAHAADPDSRWIWLASLSVYLSQDGFTPNDESIRRMQVDEDLLPAVRAIFANPSDAQAIDQLKKRYSVEFLFNTNFNFRGAFMARHLLAWAGESDYVLDVDMVTMHQNLSGLEEWAWIPAFKSVRQNPRYAQYLESAGLVEYWDATAWPIWCKRTGDERIECQ